MKNKTCPKCKVSKSTVEFSKNKGKPDGLGSWCKECTRPLINKWYANKDNASKHKVQLKVRRREKKDRLIEHFGDYCNDCGYTYPPCCYDFHHLDPSKKEYGYGNLSTCSWKRIEEEIIPKCIMLCSNCHRIRHAS